MREKVINLIQHATTSLNAMEIMIMIKPVNTIKDYEELVVILEKLCQDGIIRLTNNNGYVKNELLYGVIDEHEKGNGHLLMGEDDDIFINRSNIT